MAWREFRKGKRKKPDVQLFEFNLEDNIFQLHRELKDKTYRHSDYTSFFVKDPKLRHIHKACVKDRIIHHAIFRVLYPIFDLCFIFDSYSCRIGKGTRRGVLRLESFLKKASQNNTKIIYALKCDIRKFFDSIDQKILLRIIKRKIHDQEALDLIEIIIRSFAKEKNQGLPLGNVSSQLFANIYLNELDQFIKHELRIKHHLRYCDDFIILDQDREKLEKLIPIIAQFLKTNLKLELHPQKIEIRKHRQGINFLGYVALPYHRVLRTKTKRRMIRKINIGKSKLAKGLISPESFDQSLQSYLGVLRHCKGGKICEKVIGLAGPC